MVSLLVGSSSSSVSTDWPLAELRAAACIWVPVPLDITGGRRWEGVSWRPAGLQESVSARRCLVLFPRGGVYAQKRLLTAFKLALLFGRAVA